MDLLRQVQRTIDRHGLLTHGYPVVVGLSGGPDSLCLFHVLLQLCERYRISLHVAHLHHQIRDTEADADADFVRRLAASWQVPCTIERQDVPALATKLKLSLEEAARRARYGFLVQVAKAIGALDIAVGHNADDQTETILMHWLRGAGLAGLRGMTPLTWLRDLRLGLGEEIELESPAGGLRLIRPLLEVPRAEIERYCQAHHLQPRFDRSNLDTTYFRNRIRLELIPFLETFNPNIREVVRRTGSLIADEYAYLHQALEEAWTRIVLSESAEAITFNWGGWQALPVNLQRSLLREAIHRLRRPLRNINWIHIENALDVLKSGATGTAATLPQGLMLRMGYTDFVVANEDYQEALDLPLLLVPQLAIAVPGVTSLPNSPWQVETRIIPRTVLPADFLNNQDPWQAFLDLDITGTLLALRQRRPGDRFQPLGLGGHEKLLSEVLINAKVPAQWRDKIPLLASPTAILWVAGGHIDERAKIRPNTQNVLHLAFTRQSEGTR